jgi:hypothetical protein
VDFHWIRDVITKTGISVLIRELFNDIISAAEIIWRRNYWQGDIVAYFNIYYQEGRRVINTLCVPLTYIKRVGEVLKYVLNVAHHHGFVITFILLVVNKWILWLLEAFRWIIVSCLRWRYVSRICMEYYFILFRRRFFTSSVFMPSVVRLPWISFPSNTKTEAQICVCHISLPLAFVISRTAWISRV